MATPKFPRLDELASGTFVTATPEIEVVHLPVALLPEGEGWELVTGNTFMNRWERNVNLTEPQRRMLNALADGVSVERLALFHKCKAHSSGYRVLGALTKARFVDLFFGSNVCFCRITKAGRAILAAEAEELS